LTTGEGGNVEKIGAALSRSSYDLVLAAGGDGTVAEVMAAAYVAGLPAAIVPRGTGNIVARELRLPAGWRRAVRLALERFPQGRAVDLARVNEGYSVLAAGIGFDATVMRHTSATLKYWLGRPAYLLTGAWLLPRAGTMDCIIRADGEEISMSAVVVLVVNAGMLGASPFRFAPDIYIDDGWLDLCVYRPVGAGGRASLLWDLVTQRHDGRSILQKKVRSVEIKAPAARWLEVDGEVFRGNAVRAEILPGAIKLVA
jgi:diacylglycerol kinase family enzyme